MFFIMGVSQNQKKLDFKQLSVCKICGKYSNIEMSSRLWLADPRSVIRNLRDKGLPIEDEWRKTSNGNRYKVYFLRVVNLQK